MENKSISSISMNAFLTSEIELLVRPYDTDLTHARRVKKKRVGRSIFGTQARPG